MTTKKRVLALLIVIFLLAALFSGCSGDTAVTEDDSATGIGTDDQDEEVESNTASEDPEAPEEIAPLEITYMGREGHQWGYTLEEAMNKGMATLDYYNEKMLEEQNLVCLVDIVDGEAYKTTLSGLLAADILPDVFLSKEYMDAEVFKNAMNTGRFASIPEITEYSDGTFADLIAEGGCYEYLRAWCTSPEGGWYYLALANDCKTSINFDHDDVDYLDTFPVLSWYDMNIRVDWLRKCGLEMPTTTAEFTEALIQFQEQDVNGNGVKDERAFLGIGMSTEEVFSHCTAGWFGLPSGNFVMNSITGEIQNAVDFGDQYLQFVDFTANLYDNGVALLGEGDVWNYGNNVAGNFCSAHVMYPDNLLTTPTGDPDAQYEPMPIIQAIEDIKPIMRGQACTLTATGGISFREGVDMEAAGAYLDWLYGPTLCLLLTYGIEGKAYDINEDGTMYRYVVGVDFSAEDEEQYGDMWHYAPGALFPQVQAKLAWDIIGEEYQSVEEALENGEPYTWAGMTFDDWKNKFAEYNWDEISPLERDYPKFCVNLLRGVE